MQKNPVFSVLLFASILLGTASAQTGSSNTGEQNTVTLLERHKALTSQLSSNVYGRPIYLESIETSSMVTGDVYAVLSSPFSTVSTTFKNSNHWCDVMILHINTKHCRAVAGSNPATLKVHIGKKTPQTLQESFPLDFTMRQVNATASLLVVQLNAENGPMGTSNYRTELQAVPLEDNKTFMHLRYSYEYGVAGRLAMQGYLATAGRSKVGFSTKTPATTNAKASYVGGARGAVERNTMRYFLAIDAYLQALQQPPTQQVNTRLEKWFDSTEQYPLQLRETDKTSYMEMKKSEIQRQQASTPIL